LVKLVVHSFNKNAPFHLKLGQSDQAMWMKSRHELRTVTKVAKWLL